MMLWTCRVLYSQAGPSARGWQPLSFDGAAFHLKGTGELTRALLVLRLCAWPPLVTHGLVVSSDPGALSKGSPRSSFELSLLVTPAPGLVSAIPGLPALRRASPSICLWAVCGW